MDLSAATPRLLIVVGSGGVGKTTLAAAAGLRSAAAGLDTLVMTFDPSLRLKDALGVGEEAREREVEVEAGTAGRLAASLLDARRTFDRLIEAHAPDEAAKRRILDNHYYHNLAGHLAGILEYMAVERLWEVAASGRYERIILDTPPTRHALDFLRAPERIMAFLDSGALRIALKPWFDEEGHLRPTSRLGPLGRGFEQWLDRLVGLELLRDMAEFFQAFAPLFSGFGDRAQAVQGLLRHPETVFLQVAGPGEQRVPDTLFFARKLAEEGFRSGPVIVNRVHPRAGVASEETGAMLTRGAQVMRWLGHRDHAGLAALRALMAPNPVVGLPLLGQEPTTLAALDELGRELEQRLRSPPVTVCWHPCRTAVGWSCRIAAISRRHPRAAPSCER